MILCVCSGISEHLVKKLIEGGVCDLSVFKEQYKIGVNCGLCLETLKELVDEGRGGCKAQCNRKQKCPTFAEKDKSARRE